MQTPSKPVTKVQLMLYGLAACLWTFTTVETYRSPVSSCVGILHTIQIFCALSYSGLAIQKYMVFRKQRTHCLEEFHA